jgi:hypothetical protein
VCFGVLPRCAYLRVIGEEHPRVWAAVSMPLPLPELKCAAIKAEAPFKLRLAGLRL